eukprot:GILJ01012017.1.p1 GENE.GILJ01012017.1~~GILJ01012017.1.p1  ORF type:complete len:318 (-),score=21.14 GILJ01012017.1:74-1027(-)
MASSKGYRAGISHVLDCNLVEVVKSWKSTEGRDGKTFLPQPRRHFGVQEASPTNADTHPKTVFRSQPGVCKFWVNTSNCPRPSCGFSHPSGQALIDIRREWVRQRRIQKAENSQLEGDHHGALDKKMKGQRAAVFCQWLVDTFGRDFLHGGAGVLDVAGGRGDVSFELFTIRGIQCTLIEPRPRKLNKSQHLFLKGQPNAQLSVCVQALFDLEFLMHPEYQHLADCSLIVGMHSDQATELIVDTALKLSKPFAIVPCCVFSHEFPDRRTPEGQLVRNYDQFVAYLKSKHPLIKNDFLDFRGKNQVLYMTAAECRTST